MRLLIVESPAKAKKIQSFLGNDYIVKSSFGHIADLDKQKLNKMIEDNFEPKYIISKQKTANELKSVKTRDIILAADDDREGDAIAWHCGLLLNVNFNDNNRIIFNEISKRSIETALEKPAKLNMNSVNAQKCRQLLDLIIGYKLSPLLWKHIKTNIRGLSAGRVQSCLLKMLLDHENTIKNYVAEYTYNIKSNFSDDMVCAYKFNEMELNDTIITELFQQCIYNDKFKIINTTEKEEKSYPPNPLTTSSLQQSAQIELGLNVSTTMKIAQKLYENGKITYMRTDSTFIAPYFKQNLKDHITEKFGVDYYRNFFTKKKSKGAQEAHEAIRPTNINTILNDKYTEYDKKLYNLILKKTIQSHMTPALYDVSIYSLSNKETEKYGVFMGIYKHMKFAGYLEYDKHHIITDKPEVDINKVYDIIDAECINVENNPPKYYNESSVVKELEKNGVGRPSTYASTINTLYNRKYSKTTDIPPVKKIQDCIILKNNRITTDKKTITIPKQKNKIIVTDLGILVSDYLQKNFSNIINVQFTSNVETDLDLVSNGGLDWKIVIKKVYDSFISIVQKEMKGSFIKKKSKFGEYEIKTGKYGPYLTNGSHNYNLKNYFKYKRKNADNLTETDIQQIIAYPKIIGEKDSHDISIVLGPYGYYMKYNNKNYKLKKNNQTLRGCLEILNE